MPYTFVPEEKHAKAYSELPISVKAAEMVCKVIRKKPLKRAKRLLNDLEVQKRSLDGKYYSKAVENINGLLQSCEKNAEFLGLDPERLMVHASAHEGPRIRRRRRKGAFGGKMKRANIEVMLIERGKSDKVPMEKIKSQVKETKLGSNKYASNPQRTKPSAGKEKTGEENK